MLDDEDPESIRSFNLNIAQGGMRGDVPMEYEMRGSTKHFQNRPTTLVAPPITRPQSIFDQNFQEM